MLPRWRCLPSLLSVLRTRHRRAQFWPTRTTSRTTHTSGTHLTVLGAALGCLGAHLVIAETGQHPDDFPRVDHPSRTNYKYLICGGGVAAQAALREFVDCDQAADLVLISPEWRRVDLDADPDTQSSSDESKPAPMSGLLHTLSSALPLALPAAVRPEIVIGPSVREINVQTRTATLDDGTVLSFERCLIAVGAAPPAPPIGRVVSRDAAALVGGAHTQSDWRAIAKTLKCTDLSLARPHLTVVGGGWMALATGSRLLAHGADITLAYAEPALLARYLPKYLSRDIHARLRAVSEDGVDLVAYSAVRHVVSRAPLAGHVDAKEAEVHVGTVFDAFAIADFRTDRVLFAPTAGMGVPLYTHGAAMGNAIGGHGLVANAELAVGSDVYVAGAAGVIADIPDATRWGAHHARATGRHAAQNMLGARAALKYEPRVCVRLDAVGLTLHVMGEVDGSAESFGYFAVRREADVKLRGGRVERGVLMSVRMVDGRRRGEPRRVFVTGVMVWDGGAGDNGMQGEDVQKAVEAGEKLIRRGEMTRSELETAMDEIGRMVVAETSGDEVEASGWRAVKRHSAARAVPIGEDEILWVENEWVGAPSPTSGADKKSEAYSELLRRAAGA